ncbi:NAD(+)/NADH kinase [Terriglobus tenax]|uniref:NAD(+)/NADH kinase n=1 Tax=Terriglobus tenax TaxID=1111115 RepID=UPI0021DFD1F1|nr:NAD(+)/NADH kinase [Terriglobus tenax]
MRRVAIISKPQKAELETILPELASWLVSRGFEPIFDDVSAGYAKSEHSVERTEMPALEPELVVVLGGDGTLLSASRAFAKTGTPILSVNLGSLGFLTEIPIQDLYKALEAWCVNCCEVDERSMMHAELWRDGKVFCEFEALNDVVISKGAIARMGDFTIRLNGKLVATFRADGMIVSTPTGSTAYSLAANGPIVMPDVNAMIVNAICPHLLTIRPIVVHGDSEIQIKVEGVADQTYLTVDGQEAVEMKVDDELHCRRSQHAVKLIQQYDTGLFDVLRTKLKWGVR